MAYGTTLVVGALCGVIGVTTFSISSRSKTAARPAPRQIETVVVQTPTEVPAAAQDGSATPVLPAGFSSQPANMPPRRVPIELAGS